ncbi:hypothetical protein ACFQHW_09770 [Lapidilactobacillus achengensis]|uniref:Uncharacterized protein n=1 Tax=Lapidilactobacillus achengensis TaxID=2486000 RepID=A0ABW1USH2_9LACO|nr:hypothetical protein [Lapidilactobacillus achengensis]
MATLTNPFVAVVDQINGFPQRPHSLYFKQLSPGIQERYRVKKVKMYITLQKALEQVGKILEPDEKIVNMMPITNENGSTAATSGVMGMYAAKTATATDYIKEQDSLRDNRLLIFTDRRMIFFVVIEFIDDPTVYYSYYYDRIPALKLKQHKQSIPTDNHRPWRRNVLHWYTLDFQTTDKRVFTEILNADNADLFKRNLLMIPKMTEIEVTDRVKRRSKFDFAMSNVNFSIWSGNGMLIVGGVLLFLLVILPKLVTYFLK